MRKQIQAHNTIDTHMLSFLCINIVKSMSIPLDKRKWNQAKKLADQVYDKPSAYKSGYIVKKYKELGGTFNKKTKPVKTGLKRWFDEKWVNQHGHEGYQHKNDVYRPNKRITAKTPITWSELTPKQITRAKRTKSKGKRVNRFA